MNDNDEERHPRAKAIGHCLDGGEVRGSVVNGAGCATERGARAKYLEGKAERKEQQ
jgi:hypothetical protein